MMISRNVLRVLLGSVLGGTMGLFIYTLISLLIYPGLDIINNPFGAGATEVYSAFIDVLASGSFYELFSVAFGTMLGAVTALGPRRISLYISTVMFGALSGILIYVLGTIILNYSSIPAGQHIAYAVQAAFSMSSGEIMAIAIGTSIGFFVARGLWKFTGVMIYVALISIVLGYLLYSYTVTLPAIPPADRGISYVLIFAETASLIMVIIYTFYSLDMHVRSRWSRTPYQMPHSSYYKPKVAFHVPTFNEPAELVKDTLRSIMKIDYPKKLYQIMVIDDSTDEKCAKPLKQFCEKNGIKYYPRKTRTGFKAGALNYALKKTSDDTDLIAVIDADYQVEKNYPKDLVGYFINPDIAFIQTPQDYRNKGENFLTEQYYYADSYFYRAVMPSRNEGNAIIFSGTMGIVRKDALEQIGGWGEDFICEDAELSVRILHAGYDSLYVNKTFGRGLIPTEFDAYKTQLYRWSFGGVKILKAHFWKLLLSKNMTFRQKFDFFLGGIHWFDGIYIVMIGSIIALFAIGDLFGIPVMTYHQEEIWLIGLVPMFLILDGILRLHMALRRTMNLTFSGTVRVMGTWFSIKFNNMSAALKALTGFKSPFVRTSRKHTENLSVKERLKIAMKITKFETFYTILLLSLAVGAVIKGIGLYQMGVFEYTRILLVFWLLFYASIFMSGPLYAYLASDPSMYSKSIAKERAERSWLRRIHRGKRIR